MSMHTFYIFQLRHMIPGPWRGSATGLLLILFSTMDRTSYSPLTAVRKEAQAHFILSPSTTGNESHFLQEEEDAHVLLLGVRGLMSVLM